MKTVVMGEKRHIRVQVERKSGSFVIEQADYEVWTEDRKNMVDSGSATIDGQIVYMLLDTTLLEVGQIYYVYFWITIEGSPERINGNVVVQVIP